VVVGRGPSTQRCSAPHLMSEAANGASQYPPADYVTPPFPSLHWPPQDPTWSLYYVSDIWRFTLTWTLLIYGVFHFGAVAVAFAMQTGKPRSTWKYLWTVPVVYAFIAAFEALFAGSIVGLILGAVYRAGYFSMSTWIPFVWGWINVLVLILSSFSIQGGL